MPFKIICAPKEEYIPKPFPKFMINQSGYIVLFISPGIGIDVNCGFNEARIIEQRQINEHQKMQKDRAVVYNMDGFVDYNEPITLQNA